MNRIAQFIYEVVAGQPTTRTGRIAATIFVLSWVLMDLVQWIDWLESKL